MSKRGWRGSIVHLFHPHHSNNHRPKLLQPAQLGWLLLLAVAFYGGFQLFIRTSPTGFVLGYASSISPTKVIAQTNAQRAANGLPALEYNEQLAQAASAKAAHMFANQYWAHTAPDGTLPWDFIRKSGYGYRVAGENLARDFMQTEDMVAAWMASPTHRDNIVSPKYSQIGVAVVDGQLLGVETTLVVQMFGSPAVLAQNPDTLPQGETTQKSPPAIELAQVPQTASEELNTAPIVQVVSNQPEPQPTPAKLAQVQGGQNILPQGSVAVPPLFSPLHLTKAFFLAVILMIVSTLIYDTMIMNNATVVRLVGKNTAHIMILLTAAFLILFFQGGDIR